MLFFTKSHLKTTFFAIFALLSITLCSCDTLPKDCRTQLEKPFKAEVEGEIDGVKISATVLCDPTEHKTKEIYDKTTVTFKDGSLDGITVTLRSDGKATVRLRNSVENLPLYSGLAEPFTSLSPSVEPHSVKQTESGFEIVFKDDQLLTTCYFDKYGVIKKVEGRAYGREILLNITKFEQIEK